MGEVYKARDTRLNPTVAIKTLPSHDRDDPDRLRRVEREARAIAALAHPHICVLQLKIWYSGFSPRRLALPASDV
jgi:serine/threonine protein kinase